MNTYTLTANVTSTWDVRVEATTSADAERIVSEYLSDLADERDVADELAAKHVIEATVVDHPVIEVEHTTAGAEKL